MTPQRQLTVANTLMSVGIAPLLLAEAFVAMTLASDWKSDSRHSALALTMVISMLYTVAFSLVFALPACIWSWVAARRHPDLQGGRVLRKVVWAAWLLPLAAMFLYPR